MTILKCAEGVCLPRRDLDVGVDFCFERACLSVSGRRDHSCWLWVNVAWRAFSG
jgi:hypothetical protein